MNYMKFDRLFAPFLFSHIHKRVCAYRLRQITHCRRMNSIIIIINLFSFFFRSVRHWMHYSPNTDVRPNVHLKCLQIWIMLTKLLIAFFIDLQRMLIHHRKKMCSLKENVNIDTKMQRKPLIWILYTLTWERRKVNFFYCQTNVYWHRLASLPEKGGSILWLPHKEPEKE